MRLALALCATLTLIALGTAERSSRDMAGGSWRELPPAPLAARAEHAAVWTGQEMIVWGGESCVDDCHRADGAAHRPRKRATRRISGLGMAATLPPGWHGRVTRGTFMASTAELPPIRGWLPTELGRRLERGDLGLLLFEVEPAFGVPVSTSFYRRGSPRPFVAREFAGPGRQRFARRNFRIAGRLFDLFAEARESVPTRHALRRLNALVGSLEIARGDFYPGVVEPARFRPAPGWSTRTAGALPFRPVTVNVTVSSTIAWRDGLNALPPYRTLEALPPDGVALRVSLAADNRHVPIGDRGDRGLPRPPYRLANASCAAYEGFPGSMRACVLRALVPQQYRVEIWVIYGRKRPTPEQRARAQAQLDRLELPTWPRWP